MVLPAWNVAFVGLGSNLGQPLLNCLEAAERMSSREGIRILERSPFYRSEPVDNPQQDWFVNGVVKIMTSLSPGSLLQTLKEIEFQMGRSPSSQRWGPRIIDLDLLLYGQQVIKTARLTIPHPRLHQRRFVLIPLCDIDPSVRHPVFGVSVESLLERLDDSKRIEPIDPDGGVNQGC